MASKKKGARRRPSAPAKRSSRANEGERPFARVWAIVKRIPRGRVATYGQIAEMIDHRLSPVGVGWAIRAAGEDAIPWHRVINSKGTISTDGEHPGLQRAMLEGEGVEFDAEGRVDLATACWRPRR